MLGIDVGKVGVFLVSVGLLWLLLEVVDVFGVKCVFDLVIVLW